MNLNEQLENAKESIEKCQTEAKEVVTSLDTIIKGFENDEFIHELFFRTGFGEYEKEQLDAIKGRLKRIVDALEGYVPKTISSIKYQMELNNRN